MSITPTFFWHDYETWGRDYTRDWPAQFAGIRTDAELNEVGEPVSLFCEPPRDRLPDPESCLITGMTPQACRAQGALPEWQFARTVLDCLGEPGTVGVGYNTIRFDDHFTRFLLWRNLHEPYGREWQNDCGRWDLVDVVRCAYALRPEGLAWPRHPDGRTSFKLEDLARANGLLHDSAHEALSDVRATIALARLLRQRQPRLWDFCLSLRTKQGVKKQLALGQPCWHVSGQYGADRGCLALVFPLATHPTNANEVIVWDLAHDPSELMQLTADDIRLRLFTRQADLPEGVQRLPLKTIHINQSPVVIQNLKILPPALAERWGLNVEQALRHAQSASGLVGEMAGVWPEVFVRPTSGPARGADADLYGGFLNDADRGRLNRLREMSPQDLAQARLGFDDTRLEELVFLYRARNFPSTLSPDEQGRWAQHLRSELLGEQAEAPATEPSEESPLSRYMARLETLNEEAESRGDERQMQLVGELVEWADELSGSL